MQHEVINCPWAKLGVDLCEHDGRQLLVVVDYYSNFLEVDRLRVTTSTVIIKSLSIISARYGVPNELVSDNGPQFASGQCARLAVKWKFTHTTTSPHHAQSNGKAETSVKTIKRLFTKAKEEGISEAQALLDFRYTPTEGTGTSPVQRLMGRLCKTLLWTTPTMLDLSDIGVQAEDLTCVCEALQRLSQLRKLYLDSNPLRKSAELLTECLHHMPHLEILSLRDCAIPEETVNKLRVCVENLTDHRKLEQRHDPFGQWRSFLWPFCRTHLLDITQQCCNSGRKRKTSKPNLDI